MDAVPAGQEFGESLGYAHVPAACDSYNFEEKSLSGTDPSPSGIGTFSAFQTPAKFLASPSGRGRSTQGLTATNLVIQHD